MFQTHTPTVTFSVKLEASSQEVKVEIPTFSGLPHEDLAVWLDRLRHADSICGWKPEDNSRIMRILLRGKAADAVTSLSRKATLKEIIAKLKEIYYPEKAYEIHYRQFMNMKKKMNQSVQEFATELYTMILRVNAFMGEEASLTDREILSSFNNAMPGHIQRELANQGVRTLQEATQLAERMTFSEQDHLRRNPVQHNSKQHYGKKREFYKRYQGNDNNNNNNNNNNSGSNNINNHPARQQQRTQQSSQQKWCSFHRTNTHNTHECRGRKNGSSIEAAAAVAISDQEDALVEVTNVNLSKLRSTRTDVDVNGTLRVLVEVNKEPMYALVDTGCSICLIKGEIAERFALPITPSKVEMIMANGASAKSCGVTTFSLKIPRVSPHIQFDVTAQVVKNLSSNLILGMEFIQYNKMILNFKDNQMVVMDRNLTWKPAQVNNSKELNINKINENGADNGNQSNDPDRWLLNKVSPPIPTGDNTNKGVNELLKHYPNVIGSEVNIGRFDKTKIELSLRENARLVFARPYRIPQIYYIELKETITQLEKLGIIEKSHSEFACPAYCIKRKQGKLRMVIDYRNLNKYLSYAKFPMPCIDDCIFRLGNVQWFTSLDLNNGYYQFCLDDASKKLTTFILPFGCWQFTRLPFGISNAPMFFQRTMVLLFGHLDFVTVFMDDILIHSENYQQHLLHVRTVLQILSENNLTINLTKSKFATQQVEYLGFTLTPEGIKLSKQNLHKLDSIPMPKNKRELKGLLGSLNFARFLIPNLSQQISILTSMTSGKAHFLWKDEYTIAIKEIINQLKTAGPLKYPTVGKEFVIYTDASDNGVGAIVTQEGRIVHCFSRKLSEAQVKYTTTEKETLAIVLVLQNLRHILLGNKITCFTDHSNLQYLNSSTLQRAQRWKPLIDEFDVEIRFVPGHNNFFADFLSRHLPSEIDGANQVNIEKYTMDYPFASKTLSHYQNHLTTPPPNCEYAEDLHLWVHAKMRAPFVPKYLRIPILQWLHESLQHSGIAKMMGMLKNLAYWPGMQQDCEHYVNSCIPCQQYKVNTKTVKESLHITLDTIWSEVSIDIMGPIISGAEKGGVTINEGINGEPKEPKYLLTIIDNFSKWVELIPTRTMEAKEICEAVDKHWFCAYPRPTKIITDQGACFMSNEFQELFASYGVKHVTTTTYNPQSNGICERIHGFINNALRIGWNENWTVQLPAISWTLKTTKHRGINCAPCEAVFGVKTLMNSKDFIEGFRNPRLQSISRSSVPGDVGNSWKKGQLVFIKSPGILRRTDKRYEGPYKVIEVGKKGTYLVDMGRIRQWINQRRLKAYKGSSSLEKEVDVV